jgi:BAI1-associated protein 3
MEKAICQDSLKPVNNESKHSSSADDTSNILPSVNKFWEAFEWDTVEPVNLSNHIAYDVCQFAEIYFDKISERVESSGAMKHLGIFKVPLEVCVAANNINVVSRVVQNLIIELTKDQTQEDNARLQKIVGKTLNYGKSRTLNLIQQSANRMMPSIRKLLLEGADVINPKRDIGDRLLVYIDDSLVTLKEDLSERDFYVAKEILWKAILSVFGDLIRKSLELKRIPSFYSNLKTLLHALREHFEYKTYESNKLNDKFVEVDDLLELHGVNTSRTIHEYYHERYRMQQQISRSPFNPFGVLSIRCFFFGNTLKLEILNAKNLVPYGGSHKCDSFVEVNIIPEDAFSQHQNYKTRVHTGTNFTTSSSSCKFNHVSCELQNF